MLCSPLCTSNRPAGARSAVICTYGIACGRADCTFAHPSPARICLALAEMARGEDVIYDLEEEKKAVIDVLQQNGGEESARAAAKGFYDLGKLRAGNYQESLKACSHTFKSFVETMLADRVEWINTDVRGGGSVLRLRAASSLSSVRQQRHTPLTISVNLPDDPPGTGAGGKLAAGAPKSPALAIGDRLTDLRQGLRGGKRKEPADAGVGSGNGGGGAGVGSEGGAVARSLILTEEEEPAKRQRCRDLSAAPKPLLECLTPPAPPTAIVSNTSLAGDGNGYLMAQHTHSQPHGVLDSARWAGGGEEKRLAAAAASVDSAATRTPAVEGGGDAGDNEADSRRRLRELCKKYKVEDQGMEMCDDLGIDSVEDLQLVNPEDIKQVADCWMCGVDARLIAVYGTAM